MNRSGPRGRRFLFLLLILPLWAFTGCGTLNPAHLKNGKNGQNYQYFLSKDIELRFDFRGGEFAFRPARADSPVTIVQKNGIVELNDVAAADFSDIIPIPQTRPGILRAQNSNRAGMNGFKIVRNAVFSDGNGKRDRADIMVIHIIFEEDNDDFLEFAAFNYEPQIRFWDWLWDADKFKDRKFYLILDQDQQDESGQPDPANRGYLTYKGRRYLVSYAGEDRPYLMFSNAEEKQRQSAKKGG